ncbi:MAG: DUF6548 family protein [Eubacterium sp.]|uniref:DUF6548 family protein n=1 Tax=Eubacterium sp. TaxID=142586 RepID=UPI00399591E3
MNDIENRFFEQYKKLDNLCKDLLNSKQGVSTYIAQMENTPAFERRYVNSWDSDYKMLKHIRWVRNDIAHSDYQSECTEGDIAYARNFYTRIMKQEDPFSIINKGKIAQFRKQSSKTVDINQFRKQSSKTVDINKPNKNHIAGRRKKYTVNKELMALIIIVIVLFIVLRMVM